MREIDLTGKRFGRLKVMYAIGSEKNGMEWACECECGNWTRATTSRLNSGSTKSCGCLKREIERTDGYRNHLTNMYVTYHKLRAACYDKCNPKYAEFGAKGIAFCPEWKSNVDAFVEWSLKNGYTPKAKLLRLNQDDDYYPQNCFWWEPKK